MISNTRPHIIFTFLMHNRRGEAQSVIERKPRLQKIVCSNPNRNRLKSLKQALSDPPLNAR